MIPRPAILLAATLALTPPGLWAETPGPDAPRQWVDDFDKAVTIAASEYKPVLVMFSSPNCAWCKKLKNETIADPMLKGLLDQYILAEIDVTEDPATAMRFGVRGTPTTFILGSDGIPQDAFSGFLKPDDLRKKLNTGLNRQSDALTPESEKWLETLRAGNLNQAKWAAMIADLGRQADKPVLMRAMMDLDPLPKEDWIALLAHPNLPVRAGTLDILEQATGETFGYDPWQDDPVANTQAILRWRQWARGGNATPVRRLKLNEEQIRGVFADLVSEDKARSSRARILLEQAGPDWLPVLNEAWAAAADLPPGARKRLQEAKYFLLLSTNPAGDTERLTQGLVYGNLDLQMQSLTGMIPYGKAAIPIFIEHLDSPKAVVRETAIDGLIRAGKRQVVELVGKHLEKETDENVTFVALRALGDINSRKGLELLTNFLDNPNEDLVIAALQSISRLESKEPAADIGNCLKDRRWRVRVAALEAASKLKLNSLEKEVVALLNDPDDFVRTLTVRKVAEMQLRSALQQMAKAYYRDDALKPAVIDAYASLDTPLPQDIRDDLIKQSPEVQLSALQVLQNHDDADASLAIALIGSKREDVRMASIRLLASSGMAKPKGRAAMLEILRDATEAERIAALEAMSLDGEKLLGREPTPGWVDGLLKSASRQAPVQVSGQPTSSSVVKSFNEAHASAGHAVNSSDDVQGFLQELKQYAGPGQPERVRLAASKLLAQLGSATTLSYLSAHLDDMPANEMRYLLYDLDNVPHDAIRPLLVKLVSHDNSSLRSAAAEMLIEQQNSGALDTVFQAMTDPDGKLEPNEAFGYHLSYLAHNDEVMARLREWVTAILEERQVPEDVQRFGIALLPVVWQDGDEKLLAPYLDSANVWTKREALRALGIGKMEDFEKLADGLQQDPNAAIRETVVRNFTPNDNDSSWQHRLDPAKPTREISRYVHHLRQRRHNEQPMLTDKGKEVLQKLSQDPVASVRYQAFLALLYAGQPVDVSAFMQTAGQLPDQRAVGRTISQFLQQHYFRLTPEYGPLTRYLEHGWQSDSDKQKMRVHLKMAEDTGDSVAGDDLLALANNAPAPERYAPPVTTAEPESADRIRLVFFASAGCRDCEIVERQLKELKNSFPSIEVEKHDIRDISSMRYNEALSSRFGVPHVLRQVTPAVFAGGGYLAKEDVNLRNLGELIQQSQGTPLDVWEVSAPAMAQAESAISERFQAFTLGVVLGAGLLDGLNPCAFATIIFFLSYLQISRRPQYQIAQVGLAFVAAVFLAYFILGLGLVEVVARIEAFRTLGLIFNYVVAAIAFVIMVISIRDGILALQGRLGDMNLQLPGFLKKRVREVSRKGARHTHFVIAAFVSGAIISVLELACTGQVYLPTIMYMVKSGEHRWDAVFYLLMYNLAFILPLVIIFIAATFGLRHESLIKWQAKHTASVKFATAGLFFVLFAFLVLQYQLV